MVGAPGETPLLSMQLLGGFHVQRAGAARGVSGWQRRSAKSLTKLLATCPSHALHREQVIDILWPGTDVESALNSLGKALYAARHALEPDLPRRMDSAYLKLTDAMLMLSTEHVVIDADRFERLAETALRGHDPGAYETALAAYSGELLPEDRYAEWCAERRNALAELRIRLLLGLAAVLEECGACNLAADRLRAVLGQDPAREAVHRRLMRLYAEMGTPDQAVRQFQLCQEVLRRELGLAPHPETVSLYHDIIASRIPRHTSAADREHLATGWAQHTACLALPVPTPRPAPQPASRPAPADAAPARPFVGRDRLIEQLCDQLVQGTQPRPRLVLITGEAGIGKTRLLEELATAVGLQGAAVLWSGPGAHPKQFGCGLFAVALENYAGGLTGDERSEMARRYPVLTRFVPSLGAVGEPRPVMPETGDYHLDLMPAVARLLTELGRKQPVLLVLGDLQDADPLSLDLLRYLAHLAARRPWLLVGTVRDDDAPAGSELGRTIEAMIREGLCLGIGLRGLTHRDCDALVCALLPDRRPGDGLLGRIYTWSRGNPLFVRELVREIRQRADYLDGERSSLATVPARVRALAAARLATMDETLCRVLGLAAASRTAEISLGELRSGGAALEPPISEAALLDALDRALQLRILEERSTGYVFGQPLFRSALYENLSRHRRDQLRAALATPWRSDSPGLLAATTAG